MMRLTLMDGLRTTLTWRDLTAIASLVGSLIFIGRWVGSIESKLDVVSWQVSAANNRLERAERSIAPIGGLAPKAARNEKTLNRIEAAVDNLHYRVSQIETAVKKR